MRYELLSNSDVGVIIDPTPVLRDIKDTFVVSFDLPEPGVYVALFRDEDGIEYRATIQDGAVKVPRLLLSKEQRVGLTVCKISDEAVLMSWECHPLKIGTFLLLRQSQWQITAGTDDREIYARIATIERLHTRTQSEFSELRADCLHRAEEYREAACDFDGRLCALSTALANAKAVNEDIAAKYNQAIEVINDLSERVAALESNYDPTVIK